MAKIQEKWRESLVDINEIKFKNIEIEKIISYPPAGNDVFDCLGKYKSEKKNFIFKSERGSFANFSNEIKVLPKIDKYMPVPKILESGSHDGHVYIVMEKMHGEKLSDIFKENHNANKEKYLYNYGLALAKIHKLNIACDKAKIRIINDYPKKKDYKNFDEWEKNIINYLKENKPQEIIYNTFIHGDFHYGNIFWKNYEITAILDWEYSGMGFKEQDIAWALILRPGQKFMNKRKETEEFLRGYRSSNTYDKQKLKWCYINGLLHFYLMNKKNNNNDYLNKIKELIDDALKISD